MLPVLFSIGNISVSSFGVFLGLGFLVGVFLIWRLSRAWDLDEEKILDLTLITFLGGLIGARLYFVIENWQFFSMDILKMVLFTKFPGFSFWGGFLGGWLVLSYFCKRFKVDFWEIADIAAIGFLVGIIFSNLGCFLGGCNTGVVSNFLSIPMVGLVGDRFPVQILEAALFLVVLIKLWSQATHFHQRGKIISISLIALGVIKLITEPLKASHSNFAFSVVVLFLGLTLFYRVMKRNILADLKSGLNSVKNFFTSSSSRKLVLQSIGKSWYNKRVGLAWQLRNLTKLLRRINVKFSHKDSRFN